MARRFSSTGSYIQDSSFPVLGAGGYPMTFACWFKTDSVAASRRTLMALGDASAVNSFALKNNGAAVEVYVNAAGTASAAVSTGTVSVNTWTHAAAVFASATSRTAYQDGANPGTDATNLTPAFTTKMFLIGADIRNPPGATLETLGGNGPGDIAHVAVWNVALAAVDIAALAAGVSPLLIRPDALTGYVPVFGVDSPEPEWRGRHTLAPQSTTRSTTDPRIYFPGLQTVFTPSAVPPVDTSHTIRVWLGGADITAQTLISSLQISEVATKAPNEARFTMKTGTPAAGQPIAIYEGAALRFGGLAIDVDRQRREAITLPKVHAVDALDYSQLLNQQLVQKVYPTQAAELILKDIIATCCPGLTAANVDNLLPSITIAFDFETVPRALDQIAALVTAATGMSARWRIDYRGDLNFRISSFQASPSALTTTPVYPFRQFGYQQSTRGIVTRLYLLGKNSSTTAPASVGASSIPVSDTTIFQGAGTRKAVSGQNRISYTGTSTASGPGNLTGVSGVLYAMAQGDGVTLFAQVDDVAAQTALAALDGTSGVRELRLTDGTIGLYADLVTAATAKLATMSVITETVTYTTEDPVTAPGADVTVTVDGVNTVLQIQRQTLRASEHSSRPLQRDVTASTDWLDFYAFLNAIALKATKVG